MMKNHPLKYQFLLHLTVLIFGFTGILGGLISVEGSVIVWYRTLIGVASMALVILLMQKSIRLRRSTLIKAIITGGIVAAHWVTFFHSIKISHVSIALACLSVSTLFVSFLEPLFFKTKISAWEILTGIVITLGLGMILNVEFRYWEGITIGLISAFLSAVFTVANKQLSGEGDGFVISFIEILAGWILLSLFFLATGDTRIWMPMPASDWIYLALLGTVCTAFAFYAIMVVLRHLSAYNVALAINLEPIYGFVLAAWFFGENEILRPGFYLGSLVIIIAVFIYSARKRNIWEKLLLRFKKS